MSVFKKIIYILPFLSIILFSFYLFAPVFAKTLNSDHAVHILMSNYVVLPGDLYYWGQDRLGSLLPILTNLFIKIIPVNSITGISIVEFILLFLSFYFLQTFLKNYLSKLILCAILFIPFPTMVPQIYVGHPYVSQFFIISFILFLCNFYYNLPKENQAKKLIVWAVICILLLLSVWISDLSLVFVFVFIFVMFLKELITSLSFNSGKIIFTGRLLDYVLYPAVLLLIFFPGIRVIADVKSKCFNQPGYNDLVKFKIFRKAYSGLYYFFKKSFKFKIDDMNVSIYHWLTAIVLLAIIFILIKKIKDRKLKFNFYYLIFFGTFLLSLIATLLSNWAFLNGYGSRYFIFCYLFLMFFIIFYTDVLPKKTMLVLQFLLLTGIGSYAIRTYDVQEKICFENGTNHSLNEIQDFKQFKDAGIIADYWFSYICCIDSKMNVVATPREGTYVRNPALIDSVYNRKKIFIIRNIWLDIFPDTLIQFNRKLIKNGNPETLHNFDFCQYRAGN